MAAEDTVADDVIVSMEGIAKTFGEVTALDDVDLALRRGEVLGLVGDNGAGKSTLIKCLAGAHTPDQGMIRIDGEAVSIENPRKAKSLGIETTFQNLALVGNLSVTQNVFLGRESVSGPKNFFGVLNKGGMRERAAELLEDLQIGVDPEARVSNLSGGERQLVAISRTLLSDPEIIIMDEPTSALSVEGAERVLKLIERMQSQGISIIMISHNLEHMQRVASRIAVLHQGRDAGTMDASGVSRDDVVSRMVSGPPEDEPDRPPTRA